MTPEREELIRTCWTDARLRALGEIVFRRHTRFEVVHRNPLRFAPMTTEPPATEALDRLVEAVTFHLHWHEPAIYTRLPYLRVECDGRTVEIIPYEKHRNGEYLPKIDVDHGVDSQPIALPPWMRA